MLLPLPLTFSVSFALLTVFNDCHVVMIVNCKGTRQLSIPVPVQCVCPNHEGHSTLQGTAWIWRQNALCSVRGGSSGRFSIA